MNVDTLAITGVLRFRDALALDLHTLPTGLVAVVGANGEGKTSLLEAVPAALWRFLPTRRDRALVDYATSREAAITVGFTVPHRGQFRARVSLDAVSRQSEAVLERVDPASGLTQVLTDGKVSSYDRAIADLLPSSELVLASVFAAQNRTGSFVTQDRKARKLLFAQLLGLERYERLAETARGAVVRVEAARTRARARLDVLEQETTPAVADALAARRLTTEHQLAAARTDHDAAGARLQEAEQALARAQAGREAFLAAEQACGHARQLAQRLRDDGRRIDASLADEAQRLETTIARVRTDLAHTLSALDTKVANNQRVLADRARILTAVAEAEHADAQVAHAEGARTTAAERARAAHAAVVAASIAAGTAQADGQRLARLRQDAALLDTVPCAGAAPFAGCAFLRQALAAREAIAAVPTTTDPVADARATLTVAETEAARADAVDAAAEQAWQRATAARAALAPLVALRPRLEAAEARLAELAQERAEAEANAAATLARVTDDHAHRRASLLEARATAAADLGRVEADAVQREAERTGLAPAVAAYDAALADVAGARQAREQAAAAVARLDAERAALEAQQAALTARTAERDAVAAQVRTLESWSLAWQWLAKALGRDGLPVLEIDAAGPTVSSYANDLLHACFDGRFTLDLVTQEAKTSGKGLKETFEIKVFDNAQGGDPRDLTDLSGGEQIIVDEALKGALAIFLNQRLGTPLQTVFRDETTAPLDPDNAIRYVQMLRRMVALGGFTRIFYVSHNPAASALADAQIVVHDGTADIRWPPYPAAA